MGRNLKIALIGGWHVHAGDYARDCQRNTDTTLVTVWDDDEARGISLAEAVGAEYQPNLDAILDVDAIDGVIITTATADHPDVMRRVIDAGKHIFTEKVLAGTSAEAEAIARHAEEARVTLTVSLPRIYSGSTKAIDAVLRSGELGELSYVRVRVSHDGAVRRDGASAWLPEHFFDRSEALGGAMMDFGAHPYYLIHHFAGLPTTVSANYLSTSGHDVEDQALVVCGYPGRLTGVAEASFLGGAIGQWIEIHGSDGTLLHDPEQGLRVRLRGGQGWESRPDLDDDPKPFDRWVSAIRQGRQDSDNVAIALALTAMAEAAERSATESRVVALEESSRA